MMFWGLNLKANRKYTQTTSKAFHISQAALDAATSDGGPNQIFISCENQKFLICTLRKDVCEQVMLDFNFAEGDEICFQTIGSGNVSLSGYIVEQDPMDYEDDSDLDEVNLPDLRAVLKNKMKGKKDSAEVEANDDEDEDDDDDDDDDDEEVAGEDDDEDEDDEEVDGEDDDDDDDDDDEDDEEENEDDDDEEADSDEIEQPTQKKAKLEKPQKQQNGIAKESVDEAAGKKKKNKQEKQAQKQQQQQQQQSKKQQKQAAAPGGEKMLSGGVKIEDIRIGEGAEVKAGKRAVVYYEGRLKSNNRIFDSMKQGNGFKFSVGRGEVIKGWDVGVAGMKVGGKRRITCPPHMAYGARGSPPTIPPNSTLVFEVELRNVN